jgi:hypothetical protein
MKVKIFERSGEPGRLEREINDFLATLGPGAVLNTPRLPRFAMRMSK